jgi:hypothetical protein
VAAEQARLRQEAALRRKLEEERKQREQKRRNFLANKAESYAQYYCSQISQLILSARRKRTA